MPDPLPSIRPRAIVTPPSGSSDGGAGAVATAFDGIAANARQLAGIAARREEESGNKDAIAAFNRAAEETPAGQFVAVPEREGGLLDRLGMKDASYRNMVELLQLQRAETDAKTQLRTLREGLTGRPQEFETKAAGFIDGYLKDAPGAIADRMEMLLRGVASEETAAAVRERQALDLREARDGVNAQLAGLEEDLSGIVDQKGLAGFRAPEFAEKLASIEALLNTKADDPGFAYSQDQRDFDARMLRQRLTERAGQAAVEDEIRDTLDFGGVGSAKAKLESILTSEDVAALPRDSKNKLRLVGERLIEKREIEIRQAEAEMRARQADAQEAAYLNLAIAMEQGEAGRADAELAYENGAISGQSFLQLLRSSDDAENERVNLRTAQELFASDTPLSPTDSRTKKSADLLFKHEGGPAMLRNNPQQGLEMALIYARQRGVLPSQAATTLDALAANGTTEQQQFALDAVARIHETAPAAAEAQFSDAQIGEAVRYRDMVAAGAPKDFAAGAIMEARKAKFAPDAQARMTEATKVAKETEQAALRKLAPQPFAGGFAAETEARTQYRRLFGEFYAQHGNASDAQKQANAALSRVYGKTQVTGKAQTMAYPPEKFYAVPGYRNDWMRKQLLDDVKAVKGDAFKAESVQLVPDSTTAAEAQAGQPPTYRVVVVNEDGLLEALPNRFAFDAETALKEKFEKAEERRAALLEREKQRRAAEIEFGKTIDPNTAGQPIIF